MARQTSLLFCGCVLAIVAWITPSSSQQCLSDPPELEWQYQNGSYHASMTFEVATKTINGVTFTTRLNNGMLPSPTIRMSAGEQYYLTLQNNLGAEEQGELNTIRDFNWTNLHTHGLHISGEEPADSVFVVAEPGQSIEYYYDIPCDHAGGTVWYHPHHHGSTAVQVGGGAAGALIAEPNEIELTSFPSWYTSMSEIILVIQHLDFEEVVEVGGDADKVFTTSSEEAFRVINGEYQPTICLERNTWKKLRMVHVDLLDPMTLTLDADADVCSLYLLSKDGVLVHGVNNEVPRYIEANEMYFTVASRADVAVQCSVAGTYNLIADGDTIAYIEVSDSGVSDAAEELTVFHPLRPAYLQSLLFYDGDVGEFEVELDDEPMTVNGVTFQGYEDYLFEFEAGTVQEWTILENEEHPYHIHVNHFQVLQAAECGVGPDGWTEPGDWLDVLDFQANVRFHVDTFGGKVVIHCHILEHEDEGLMGVVNIKGGCNAFYEDIANADSASACVFETCADNSSFSDYDWATESVGFEARACLADDDDADEAAAVNVALVVGLTVGAVLLR